jgi:hypothetical protein
MSSLRVRVGGGGRQRADVRIEQEKLGVAHDHVGFVQLRTPGAHALDLPALQDQARFEPLLDRIVVAGLPVLNDRHVLSRTRITIPV